MQAGHNPVLPTDVIAARAAQDDAAQEGQEHNDQSYYIGPYRDTGVAVIVVLHLNVPVCAVYAALSAWTARNVLAVGAGLALVVVVQLAGWTAVIRTYWLVGAGEVPCSALGTGVGVRSHAFGALGVSAA